jgi:nicotinate-nucleotide adenylyltransferase
MIINVSNAITLPPIQQKAKIGILGGSFDPPHFGHITLALSFLSLEPIDELWVIPCAHHAMKNPSNDFIHRFNMCELAFSRLNNTKVLDIEKHLAPPNYTIQTIDYIKNIRPDVKIFLALGSDLLATFYKWHKPKEIVSKTEIIIFERPHFPITQLPDELLHERIHRNSWLIDIASTSIRASQKDIHKFTPFIDHLVLDYIKKHNLYY